MTESASNNETPAPAPAAPEPAKPAPEGVALCAYEDFAKIRLAVAEIVAAEPHPAADKLLKLQLRVGDRAKQICAGIRAWYDPATLVGRRIVIVDNLAPRKLRGEVSEGMLLAASTDDKLTLVTTDDPLFPSGAAVR